MTTLAEDLLDLGRLDADVVLVAEPIELRELAGTIAGEVAAVADDAGVTLELVAPEPVWAVADPRAAARVVRALLDNALRHGAPPYTTVTITVDEADGRARARVRDEGAGVPEADRERIFGRFERGATTGSGFGLGLAIARGLARQMGGDVRAHAAGPGASFEATLPACEAPAGARDDAPLAPRERTAEAVRAP